MIRPRQLTAALLSIIAAATLFLSLASGQTTDSGYLAKVTNSENTAASASYFTCTAAVTADGSSAIFAYQLSEESGAKTPADYSGGSKLKASYEGSMTTTTVAPVCGRDPGGAYLLDGSTSYITTKKSAASTDLFTEEIWFKTTVASGVLIGLGSSSKGPSSTVDRNLYIDSAGRVVFGVYDTANRPVVSPRSYTDGQWHQAVATLSPAGMILYPDGTTVATNPAVTTDRAGNEYWRIGYDNITGWPGATTKFFFTGSLRFAAVYNTALTPSQIKAHYAASL